MIMTVLPMWMLSPTASDIGTPGCNDTPRTRVPLRLPVSMISSGARRSFACCRDTEEFWITMSHAGSRPIVSSPASGRSFVVTTPATVITAHSSAGAPSGGGTGVSVSSNSDMPQRDLTGGATVATSPIRLNEGALFVHHHDDQRSQGDR